MGKKSVKENKNIYQLSREEMSLTREAASELLEYITPERIEKIESEKVVPHPDEVLTMEKGYKNPTICNYYCTHECPIGKKYVPEAGLEELSQITIEILASLNSMEKEKNRLIEISVDGRVTDFERHDFDHILGKLNSIDKSIQAMRIWFEHAANTGMLDEAEN